MINNKRQMFVIIGAFVLVLLLGTTTYAFFNYTRTGAVNNIKVGRISFVSKNEQTISLTNLFPIDPTDSVAMNDSTKVGTYEIEIKGDTDYSDGVEYLISAVDTNIYTNQNQILPISLDFTISNGLGASSDNYWTARESKNATIYKKLVGDTLVGDQMLLVGYIKPNTTSGTAEGVDGKITIKAYLDENNIIVSDTYDGTESDNMGTTNNEVESKTIFTTSEWNALENTGVSFKIKVEANEGIWVIGSLDEIMRTKNYNATLERGVRDNESSQFVSSSSGINFGTISSNNNGKGIYMLAGTQNDTYPILYYRGEVTDNNVKLGNYCWKMVRTTGTGGVKLIYNGESSAQNGCNNTGTNSQITVNISGTDTNTFKFSGDNLYKSPAYNGYMWGTAYEYSNLDWTSGAKFGSSFTWNGTNYTLVDATETTPTATHHYSCNSTDANATCTNLLYVYYWSGTGTLDNNAYYITLQNGKGINDAIADMQTNTTDSNAKTTIETWYASNMNTLTNKLEDTVYCNDRRMNTLGDTAYFDTGWKADGNLENDYLYYLSYGRLLTGSPSLSCSKNDSFTWKSNVGNKKLEYPVAMLSSDEIMLAGGSFADNNTYYLYSGSDYLALSPHSFYYSSAIGLRLYSNGSMNYSDMYTAYGIRPVVSLKPGIPVVKGLGTVTDPYVIG